MIYALHGFLGKASDWSFLNVYAEDLWSTNLNLSMKDWALRRELPPGKKILLGYSMGGRLAMHLALERPTEWSAAIFVSANPGNSSERIARAASDEVWAQRFLNDDWAAVVRDWNLQSLFRVHKPSFDSIPLERHEKDFDRAKLALALTNWSLARQDDLAVRLLQLKIPVLWVAGEEDEKYCSMFSSFPNFQKVSHAAHRAPWDNPGEFQKIIKEFISR